MHPSAARPRSHLRAPLARAVAAALLAATAAASLAACSSGETKQIADDGALGRDSAAAPAEPLPPGFVLPPVARAGGGAYQPGAVADGGRITGVVELAGDAPPDSTVAAAADVRACGGTLVDRTVTHRGRQLAGAVAWLADVRTGKPLPLLRRFTIALDGCLLVPRTQATLAGGTLNVKSGDALRSELRFLRRPASDVVSRVAMTGAGQVVPDERVLAEPGVVEVRGTLPPWLRAWILVFDHPYHAVTGTDGAFALDSVPAGAYTLHVWHERLGVSSQSVTVSPGQATTVTFRLGTAPAVPVASDSSAGVPPR